MVSPCVISVQIGERFGALGYPMLIPCHGGAGKVNKGFRLIGDISHEIKGDIRSLDGSTDFQSRPA
jgi:hypothetical protein